MRLILAAVAALAASPALAAWSPSQCGAEPQPPHYDLATRAAYNAAVKAENAYQTAAKAYSACVLKQAHDDQTAISQQAQNRIADIQTIAVGKQQAIYARLAADAERFKQAAARLAAK